MDWFKKSKQQKVEQNIEDNQVWRRS